jgi:4-amino-4-deoxy-L-arabinose transferase-like glycosyltransferase
MLEPAKARLRARRRTSWTRLDAAAIGAAVVALVASHASLIGYKAFANVDEAYASALAQRLLDGHRLYVGAISQRGPLMYYLYALFAYVLGWDDVAGLRVVALGFGIASVLAVAWATRRVVSRRAGGLAGLVLAYALVVGLPPLDGLALHGETMQIPVLVAAAALPVLACRREGRPRLLGLFGAGVLFGAAIAIKQSAALQPVPVLVLLLAEWRRRGRTRAVLRDAAAFGAGIALVIGGFVVHAALTGALPALVYYCFTYNMSVHLRPGDGLLSRSTLEPLASVSKQMTVFVGVVAAALLVAARFWWRRARAALRERSASAFLRGFGARQYVVLHFLVATAGASAMYRFFPHYYLPALGFGAMVVAGLVARVPRARVTLASATAVLAAATLFVSALNAWAYEKIDGRVTHSETPQRLGRYIEATTPASEKIFVWGFSPWLYQYSHRRPAGRYVFETYVTGFVPWFFDAYPLERSRVVPGSLEALLGDLDRERPEVVVDAGSVIMARPMRAYAKAAAWLHRGYCFELRVSAYDVYRRKPASGCATPDFPEEHAPVDFNDVPMPVPTPLLVDGPSRPLCGSGTSPVFFRDAGRAPARLDLLVPASKEKDFEEHRAAGFAYPDELSRVVPCPAP